MPFVTKYRSQIKPSTSQDLWYVTLIQDTYWTDENGVCDKESIKQFYLAPDFFWKPCKPYQVLEPCLTFTGLQLAYLPWLDEAIQTQIKEQEKLEEQEREKIIQALFSAFGFSRYDGFGKDQIAYLTKQDEG